MSARSFELEVAATERLSPSFLRVVLRGEQLRHFADPGPLGPRDLRVKLLLPASGDPAAWRGGRPPGWPAAELAALGDGWYLRWRALDPDVRGVMRTYTVRRARLDGADPQLDVDVVLHDGPSGHPAGPAVTWALAARAGDLVTLVGPGSSGSSGGPGGLGGPGGPGGRGDFEAYGGVAWRPPAPAGTPNPPVLLVADETAVPAVLSILEHLPAGWNGHALLEVPGRADVLPVRAGAGMQVRWLPRSNGEGAPAPRGRNVVRALRSLLGTAALAEAVASPARLVSVGATGDPGSEALWEEPSGPAAPVPSPAGAARYAWVAGESGMVRAVRRMLLDEVGMDRSTVAFMGYWREGRTAPD